MRNASLKLLFKILMVKFVSPSDSLATERMSLPTTHSIKQNKKNFFGSFSFTFFNTEVPFGHKSHIIQKKKHLYNMKKS